MILTLASLAMIAAPPIKILIGQGRITSVTRPCTSLRRGGTRCRSLGRRSRAQQKSPLAEVALLYHIRVCLSTSFCIQRRQFEQDSDAVLRKKCTKKSDGYPLLRQVKGAEVQIRPDRSWGGLQSTLILFNRAVQICNLLFRHSLQTLDDGGDIAVIDTDPSLSHGLMELRGIIHE